MEYVESVGPDPSAEVTPWILRRSLVVGIVHMAATWFMVGLIWTIHFVHYPLFAYVGPNEYVAFQAEHVLRIGTLLAIPWAVEGISLLALVAIAWRAKVRQLLLATLTGAVAMAVILVISGFFSAPAHEKLADGFDAGVHAGLMRADLVRTMAWTVRGGVAIWVFWLLHTMNRRDRTNT